MIDLIRGVLVAERLIPPDARIDCNVLFARRYLVQVVRGRALAFTVKVAPEGGLRPEYDALVRVAPVLPDRVPRPLVFPVLPPPLELAVFEGIEHRALDRTRLPALAEPLADALADLARAGRESLSAPLGEGGPAARFGISEAEAAESGMAARLAACAPLLEALPPVLQHGDLALNNLGLAPRGVVIFDWEDFGEVTAPGYDLCVLICSAVDFDPETMTALIARRGPDWLTTIVARYCAAAGLRVEDFFRMVPLHLLAFLQLKRRHGYGADIVRDVGALISALGGPSPR
jgi:hypothetical protein